MRAIVIGRHTPSGQERIEIFGNEDRSGVPQPRPIIFPAHAEDCNPILEKLLAEATDEGCALLFQAIPAQLAAAIATRRPTTRCGAIVNVPDPRLTAVSREFYSDAGDGVETIASAVAFVNPRAKIAPSKGGQALTVTVDPFSPFIFSHIQWFDGSCSNWSIRGFFARFGLLQSWINQEGDILINEDDSGEFAAVNDGDEVTLSDQDIFIDSANITVKSKSRLTTDFFHAEMEIGNPSENKAALIRAINEAKDNEVL